MSLTARGRGVFGFLLGGLGVLGRRALGRSGSEGGVFATFSLPSSPFSISHPPSELLPHFCQRVSFDCGCRGFTEQGCDRTSVLGAWLLQPFVYHSEGHGRLEACYRSLSLHRFIRLSRFRMETLQSVLQSLRPGEWMVSIDLQDAYFQVPIHPASRKYLRFCIGPQTFQFRALCFGLSSAPQVFTRVMTPISSIMHRFGYRILRYLDDWLVLGSSHQEIVRVRDFLLSLCEELGVMVNLSKSSLTPTQTIDYLGMTLQSTPLKAFPTQARIQKVLSPPPLESSRSVFGGPSWV